jgi:hypothetical protein
LRIRSFWVPLSLADRPLLQRHTAGRSETRLMSSTMLPVVSKILRFQAWVLLIRWREHVHVDDVVCCHAILVQVQTSLRPVTTPPSDTTILDNKEEEQKGVSSNTRPLPTVATDLSSHAMREGDRQLLRVLGGSLSESKSERVD